MKKIVLLVLTCQLLSLLSPAQVLFSDHFNSLSLQTYTDGFSTTQYAAVPGNYSTIDDGFGNNAGTSTNPNAPFHIPALKTTGWAAVYNTAENDTFLVSTSWLDSTTYTTDRWVVTPFTSTISANTVLTWRAKSPDPSFPDGYEVYGTNVPGTLNNQSFTLGDRLFYILDGNTAGSGEKSTWTKHSVNLSAFAGQSLRFAFHENSKNMYQLWVDDIEVITLPYANDAAIQNIVTNKYNTVNSVNLLHVNVTNNGANDLVTLNMGYSINNASPDYEELDPAVPLTYGQTGNFTFALPYSLSSPGYYTIKTWISQVNSGTDENHSNDTAVYHVTIQDAIPSKIVMIEQFVSANDGESPDAQARTTALQSAPAIVVNIHDQDSLKEPGSAALITDYKKESCTALLDRNYQFGDNIAIPRPGYGPYLDVEAFRISPAAVSILNKSYNAATRQLSFTIKADFIGEVNGDYRINAYLTENQVCGPYNDTTINGYNQLNNYYTVPWSQYSGQGYFSPTVNTYVMNALLYKHQNTLVYSFDGAYGLPGTIPSGGGTQGQSFQKTFTVTLPTPANGVHKFNPDNLYIVGFLAEYDTDTYKRAVLNAVQEKLNSNPEFVGIPELAADPGLNVYPNPSNGLFHLDLKSSDTYVYTICDLFGKCLKTGNCRSSDILDLSGFSEGMYLLSLHSGKQVVTQKLIIQKN